MTKFKVGDIVFSPNGGWGVVYKVDLQDTPPFQLYVKFDDGCSACFCIDGKYEQDDLVPTLLLEKEANEREIFRGDFQ